MNRSTLARRYAPLVALAAVQLLIIATVPSTASKQVRQLAAGGGGAGPGTGVGGSGTGGARGPGPPGRTVGRGRTTARRGAQRPRRPGHRSGAPRDPPPA